MKYILRALSILTFILAFVLIKLAMNAGSLLGDGRGFVWSGGLALMGLGSYLYKKSKFAGQKKGTSVLQNDSRPPVLYLRSFKHDPLAAVADNDGLLAKFITFGLPQNLNTEEEQLAMAVTHIGPFIAIGNPSEEIPRLGAARIYAEHATWQDVVKDLTTRSRLVLLRVGNTPGFWWEAKMAMQCAPIGNIIFLLPDNKPQYAEFKKRFAEELEIQMPDDYIPRKMEGWTFSALLTFTPTRKPLIIYCKERTRGLFQNSITKEMRGTIDEIIRANATGQSESLVSLRAKPERTFMAGVQRIGGILILALITASIFNSCTGHDDPLEHPRSLITWGVCTLIWYLLLRASEKS